MSMVETPIKPFCNNFPLEIFAEIIKKVNTNSSDYLVNYANLYDAFQHNDPYSDLLLNEINQRLFVVNHCPEINTSHNSLLNNLINFEYLRQQRNCPDTNFDKIIIIINESFKFDQYIENIIFESQESIPIDIVFYFNSENLSILNINSILSLFPTEFSPQNIFFEFYNNNNNGTSTILANRSLFGILDSNFFIHSRSINNNSSWLVPRCKNIVFPSIQTLQLDYLTMDSFIYNTIDSYGINDLYYAMATTSSLTTGENNNSRRRSSFIPIEMSSIEYIFKAFLKDVSISLPNLTKLSFINKNKHQETCNFIDLSTLTLNKFKSNYCPLKYLFKLHSFQNFKMPKIIDFSGHRFKFDETTLSSSKERLVKSIRDNILLLREIAQLETDDACPYFRIELFPPGVQTTKLLNWLPLESFNTISNNNININNNDFHTKYTIRTSRWDNYSTSASSINNNDVAMKYKPILCLKCDSLQSLELKLLPIEKNHSCYIQGLFLSNLKELTLQNNNSSSNNGTNDNIFDVDNINPLGFSSWNNLPNCQFIHFTTDPKQENNNNNNFIFKIDNLKENLPMINLRESFDTFVDERQRFIVI